ncbi:hypothetical protein LCI18_006692 [Fusarium solani-melongenae]|uniref:Uncharacterized protein n=1 Tax=Fusarium solani subsp. cucurbitae TaxID=2747967 RepID=A0ACD3Z3I5_FUSSC|nr:hypothetical protein LCI18_006692 [Fusarium solani-melongenae]
MLAINLVQVDPTSFTKKRKPNSSACVRCHERKVKCDAGSREASGGSCKNCLASGVICRTHLDGRYRSGTNTGSQNDDVEVSTGSGLGFFSENNLDHVFEVLPYSPEQSDSGRNHADSPTPNDSFRDDQHDTSGSASLPQLNLTGQSLQPAQPPAAADQVISDPSRFPPMRIDRFEAYVKDSLGSYAPSFLQQQQQQQHDYAYPHANTVNDTQHDSVLTGGFGQGANWFQDGRAAGPLEVNMSSRSTLHLEQQALMLDSADMEYLKAKGAFDLPPQRLQEDLVEAYFADVHPTAPVINRYEFLSAFHGGGSPSRLLLFAIFTSGSRACRNPALLDSNGSNQSSAQRFYRATKALLDTGYEQSRLVRVQALLLLTWWWDKKDDGGRNMRSCAVDAINTAQSIGMHRWDHYPKDDLVLGRLWKRIWWTCFNRDVAVAVSHGLPCIISLSDFDVYPLTTEDFIEEPEVAEHLHRYPYQPIEVAFSIEVIRVAEALHHIHQEHFVTQHLQKPVTGSIAEREANLASLRDLGQSPLPPGEKGVRIGFPDDYNDHGVRLCRDWLDRVPQALKYDVNDIQKHEFWPAFLHILYYTNIMLRFRGKAVARQTQGRAEAERLYCQARGQSPNDEVRRDAQTKYSLCLHVLYEFSQLWVSASLIHRLFETLQANMQLPRSSGSSLFDANHWQAPLPGLSLSSDITESYMRHTSILSRGFVAAVSRPDSPAWSQYPKLLRYRAVVRFLLPKTQPDKDMSPSEVMKLTSTGKTRVNFFGLSENLPADGIPMFRHQKENDGPDSYIS